jgi:ATP-binding cassette subfamily B protein
MNMFAGLNAESYDRQYSDARLLQRLGIFVRPYWYWVLGLVLVIAGGAMLNAWFPVLVAQLMDALPRQPQSWLWYAGYALLSGLALWGLNYLRALWFAQLTGGLIADLRSAAFDACLAHDLSFYDEHAVGRIISRITGDTQEFAQALRLIADTVSQFASMIILLVLLTRISGRLTLAIVAPVPLLILFSSLWRTAARRSTTKGFRAIGNVNTAIQEAVTGISVAKNFRQEGSIYAEFDKINQESYHVNLRRGIILATVFPVLNALMGVGYGMLAYLGGQAAAANLVSLGAWALFLQSVDRFWFPLSQLASFWSQLQAGLAAAERVFALIDAESTVQQTGNTPIQTALRGQIEFRHLMFRYQPQLPGKLVLPDFSLSIAPGESVALVGHTGAGKSSITKLLARFYEFQGGQILIDGQDIRSFDLQAYRRQLGIITQVPFLFSGDIAENIRYAAPKAREADIMALANQIGAGEWLAGLPQGLRTQVGERGNRLSLGQRQLVALLRVLVQNPAIFLLDEATASIDPFTESQIQTALQLLLKDRTSIIIAHRLSTVRSADRILVLSKGQLQEQGSHEQLLQQGGHYAELYQTYFRHQSLQYIEEREYLAPLKTGVAI